MASMVDIQFNDFCLREFLFRLQLYGYVLPLLALPWLPLTYFGISASSKRALQGKTTKPSVNRAHAPSRKTELAPISSSAEGPWNSYGDTDSRILGRVVIPGK